MNISSRKVSIECIRDIVNVVPLYNGSGGLHAWSTLAVEWQRERENGLRPAEIMELVCSPRTLLLAGINSVNSRSFYSQTLSQLGQFSESTRGDFSKMDDGWRTDLVESDTLSLQLFLKLFVMCNNKKTGLYIFKFKCHSSKAHKISAPV